jgi:hypothetical protein
MSVTIDLPDAGAADDNTLARRRCGSRTHLAPFTTNKDLRS